MTFENKENKGKLEQPSENQKKNCWHWERAEPIDN